MPRGIVEYILNTLHLFTGELQNALEFNLRVSGYKDIANQLHKLLQSIDEDCLANDSEPNEQLSSEEALALFVDAKLTKYQYNRIRFAAINKHCSIFPAYKNLLAAKTKCYPPNLYISDKKSKLELQCLLDLTASRLLLSLELKNNLPHHTNLVMISKWGCDGSSGHSLYKQNFENVEHSDESVFMVSLVPLELSSGDERIPFWVNPHPSSTKLCRPVMFEFCKETKDKILDTVNVIKNEINCLSPTEVPIENQKFSVTHNLVLTMLDGKVCQTLTNTPSAACCPLCGAKPSELNDIDTVRQRPISEGSTEYGLSTLHAWIRFMECILHIAYRLDLHEKKWSVRSPEDKLKMKSTKKRIQLQLKQQLGIIVDIPRQGSGTSNDGNTARRFFRNWETVAEITGVDKNLIYRFYIILQVLASGELVDSSKFEQFARQTAYDFVDLYGWYFMPSAVHRVLIHCKAVLDSTLLPIGKLSEEAQESRNKDFKRFRQSHTRKTRRSLTNEDLIHHLLVSSDPVISSLRAKWNSPHLDLEEDAKNLLSSSPNAINIDSESEQQSYDAENDYEMEDNAH